jgi:Trk K+ transport system NAD-binding subunit
LTRLLARDLEDAGKVVLLVDLDEDPRENRNAQDELRLARAGASNAICVMAATGNDERNLNLCRAARSRFRVPTVVARMGLLGEMTYWARLNDAGMIRMSWKEMVPSILGTVTPSHALLRLAQATNREQVADLKLLNPDIIGRTIGNLGLHGCEVLALERNDLWVDEITTAKLGLGDVLTVVGTKTAINKACESLTTL